MTVSGVLGFDDSSTTQFNNPSILTFTYYDFGQRLHVHRVAAL